MAFSIFSILIGAVVIYLVSMILIHKFFEKIFKMLFFIISAILVLGAIYFLLMKGA
ncbi:hypothetical protein HYX05_04585 [Candidatus Woesearchaeota archaeon]|nr:hypothetical protein [Candidatus Woesearchaeota archaeon]